MATQFKNRMQAGVALAERLTAYARRSDAIVLALPRGGVPVGFALAKRLEVTLDILIVRKLRVPGHDELAMGAVASGGMCVFNDDVLAVLDIDSEEIVAIAHRELLEVQRREKLYRASAPATAVAGRIAILVDDGLATGATMRAAVKAVRHQNPAWVIVAAPVAAPDSCEVLRADVDEIICLCTPEPFHAVGLWYEDFVEITDAEVRELLAEAGRRQPNRSMETK